MIEILKELTEMERLHFKTTDVEEAMLREMKTMREFNDREANLKVLREREQREEELRDLRRCAICYEDSFPKRDGLECNSKIAPHFYCSKCLKGTVLTQLTADERPTFIRNICLISCPGCKLTNDNVVWREKELALHVDDITFAFYLKACQDVTEIKVQKRERELAEQRIGNMKKEIDTLISKCKDATMMRVYNHRMHIIDNILTLRCPNAGMILTAGFVFWAAITYSLWHPLSLIITNPHPHSLPGSLR
jgi:hypothetical protein